MGIRKRTAYLLPFGALCVAVPIVCLGIPHLFHPLVIKDSIGEFGDWKPTRQEIAQQVGLSESGTRDNFQDARHKSFAHLFKERFRSQNSAVGVEFVSEKRIQLMFAPVIPRWDMARVGIALYEEARDVFGTQYEIDMYETYISMPRKKMAELRSVPGGTDAPNAPGVAINFDSRFALETPRRRTFLTDIGLLHPLVTPTFYLIPATWNQRPWLLGVMMRLRMEMQQAPPSKTARRPLFAP